MSEVTDFKLGELYRSPGGRACGAFKAKSDAGRYRVSHA